MEKGIDLSYEAVKGMLAEAQLLLEQTDPAERFRGEIAVSILEEALGRILECKNEI